MKEKNVKLAQEIRNYATSITCVYIHSPVGYVRIDADQAANAVALAKGDLSVTFTSNHIFID